MKVDATGNVITRCSDDLATIDAAAWSGEYTASPADLALAPAPWSPIPLATWKSCFG